MVDSQPSCLGLAGKIGKAIVPAVRQSVSDLAVATAVTGQSFAHHDDNRRGSKLFGAECLALLPHFPRTRFRRFCRRVANSLAQFGWACGCNFGFRCHRIARWKSIPVAFGTEAGGGEFRVSAAFG